MAAAISAIQLLPLFLTLTETGKWLHSETPTPILAGTVAAVLLRLILPDRVLALPEVTRPALRSLLTGRPHLAGALPGLDAADGVVLVRRLLREAVLVPA